MCSCPEVANILIVPFFLDTNRYVTLNPPLPRPPTARSGLSDGGFDPYRYTKDFVYARVPPLLNITHPLES